MFVVTWFSTLLQLLNPLLVCISQLSEGPSKLDEVVQTYERHDQRVNKRARGSANTFKLHKPKTDLQLSHCAIYEIKGHAHLTGVGHDAFTLANPSIQQRIPNHEENVRPKED
jgi:hypothetical protein